MRNIYRIALVSVLAFSLAAAPTELFAQARRSSTTSASSSRNKEATTSGTSAPRSSAATTSGAPRSSAATTAGSTSRSTAATPDNQVRRSTTTSTTGTSSRSSASSGTTARRSTTATSGTTGTTATSGTSGTGGTTSATAAPRSSTAAPRSNPAASRTSTAATQAQAPQQTASTDRAARGSVRTTSSRGLTSTATTARTASSTSRNYVARDHDNRNLRLDDSRNLNRVPPRERDFMTYDRPGSFYSEAPHFFGYRIQTLPPRYRHITHWGIDYYYYDNVYYRRYGTYYVVCRPPFGIALDIALRDAVFASVRFSYYHNVYRTYDILDDNYRTIMEQNRIIAQNNAAIAAQNSALALNSRRAATAFEIAQALGLVQSYADINTEYFYEDGVFYTVNRRGRYEVIVPPAGALVDELPDDYDIIVLNGVEYYKVEDTVYRLVLVEGTPCLEVLGQMYGKMARQYNYYYN